MIPLQRDLDCMQPFSLEENDHDDNDVNMCSIKATMEPNPPTRCLVYPVVRNNVPVAPVV